MSDATMHSADATPRPKKSLMSEDARTKKRNAAERRFRMYGAICVGIAVVALVFLMSSILRNGSSAFFQTYITLDVELLEEKLDKNGNRDLADIKKVSTFGYAPLIKQAMNDKIEALGIEIDGLSKPQNMISKEAAAQLPVSLTVQRHSAILQPTSVTKFFRLSPFKILLKR